MMYLEVLEEHILKLERVFRKLTEANVTIELNKLQFIKHKTKILEYITESEEIRINPERNQSSNRMLKINDSAKKKFLGFTGYYEIFIEGYSNIGLLILQILRKNKKQVRTKKEQEDALKTLQKLESYS
jgi:hypothetical protein